MEMDSFFLGESAFAKVSADKIRYRLLCKIMFDINQNGLRDKYYVGYNVFYYVFGGTCDCSGFH
jgi:hypothetical protein